MFRRVAILLFFIVVAVKGATAQEIEYGVKFDSTHMLIGDQQNLTYIVKSQIPLNIIFPYHEKSIGDLEIISGPEIDSLHEKGAYTYTQTYKVTTFDTGLFVIPPQSIQIALDGFNNSLTTDSIMVAVSTFEVDKKKGLIDIEGPMDAPVTFREALPYILYSLLGLALIAGIIYVIMRRKSGKPILGSNVEPSIPPYQAALQGMRSIDERKLWQAGNEKEFYTELTMVLREYLDGELGLQCMESTSVEILGYLKQCQAVDERSLIFIEEMLSSADLVKFAKMTPLQDENYNFMKGTGDTIDRIHNQVVAIEQAKAEQAKAESETQSVTEEKEEQNG